MGLVHSNSRRRFWLSDWSSAGHDGPKTRMVSAQSSANIKARVGLGWRACVSNSTFQDHVIMVFHILLGGERNVISINNMIVKLQTLHTVTPLHGKGQTALLPTSIRVWSTHALG